MQNFWAFITQHFHWLLFIFLEAVSVVMLFSYNNYQASVWISSANSVVGKVYEWQANVEHYFSLTKKNERLTQQNILLEEQLNRMTQQLLDMKADTSAFAKELQRDTLENPHLINAKVISNSISNADNLITIDKGSADGVQTDMGVICGTGIVGVVYLVSPHYSIVISALNERSRISCSIRGSNYFGYLSWTGGDVTRAYIEGVPRHARFKKGNWIETSGYSSIFPHGVSVGTIEKIYNSHDGLSYRLLIKLSTDFANLRDVCVIDDKEMVDRMRLKEAANDSLMLKQKKE